MEIAKASSEALADYIDFLLEFSRAPGEATSSRTVNAEGKVSRKLILFSGFSAGVAIVIVQIGAAIGMAEDRSFVVQVAGKLDQMYMPVAALLAIVALTIVGHIMLIAVGLIGRLLGHEPFNGSVAASINASLGFAAWSIPLVTIAVVGLRIAGAHQLTLNPVVVLVVLLLLGIAFWAYLAAAFAGAHRIHVGRAGTLFALTFALIAVLEDLVKKLS